MATIVAILWAAAPHLPTSLLLHAAGLTAGAGQPTDTDGDTMPDAWETFFGLNPNDPTDAAGDPDGDGLTNAQELAAGRHPVGRHTRYFAEGSTGFFDTSVGLLNLSATDTAHVALALLSEGGGIVSHQLTLGPRARQSVSLNTALGVSGAVAIIVESDVPVAADRSMTWGTTGVGLSLDSGSPGPATTWYFAEGATGPFLLYYLFENPGTTPAQITVRYLVEGAPPVSKTHTLPPQSRTTIFVNGEDPALAVAALGAIVTADVPILAERAMYVETGGAFGGGSASSGWNQLSTQWYFGEGATGPFFHAFLSLVNPGLTAATATVTYHMSDGSTAAKAYDVPAEGRRTVYFNGEAASDPALAALANGPVWFTVSSTQPILGERAMWWSTWPWYEGHAAPGSTATDVSWAVAEGRHGGATNEQTYVLIGNTTTTAGQVRLTLIPDTGATSTRDLPIAAGERLTVDVGDLFGLTDARFSVIVDSLGAPEVPLAVDYARYRSVNGVPFSGGGAAPAIAVTPAAPTDAAPSVVATTPSSGATGVSSTDNLVVTFSEAVHVAAGAFVLQCPTGTPVTLAALTASPATAFTLDPAISLPPSTTCTLTVVASAITDVDTADPPDAMAADLTITFTTAAESAPVVSSTTPAAGAIQVAPGANLTVTFSEPVTVAGSWFQIVCATSGTRTVADTAVSGGPSAFAIDPNVNFVPGETCTVTIAAAQVSDQDAVDPPETMAADFVFGFTIDVAPTVTATTPINGATTVSTAASLGVTFSEAVNVTGNWFQIVCATSGTRNVADAVVSGGPASFVIDPVVDFAPGELCTVTINALQVSDQDAGDPPDTLAANHVFSFTTDTPPGVTATSPVNGATTGTTTTNLTITFSEPVTVAANWFQIVCATSGTRNVSDTLVSGGPTIWTIDPAADFAAGESCTVTVNAAQVSDQDAGDPPDTLTANHVFSFSIDAAPSVTATTPTNGGTSATNADLSVTFSEPVDVTGTWFQIVCTVSGTRNVGDAAVIGGPTAFTINPNADFGPGESCTVTVFAAQVTDQDAADPPDTPAANHVVSFTLDAAPSVTATTPTNGATATTTTDLTITFNEAVNVTGNWFQIVCATSGPRNVADTAVTGGPTAFTINPNVDFIAGESCTATVFAVQVTDQDGLDPPDAMTANHVFSYTIDAQPSVNATTPTNGATQVASNTNVIVGFTEAVDVTGNWFQIVCSSTGTRNVAETVVTGGPATFTINPNVDFGSGETCTLTVFAAQVTDQDAVDPPDTMAANHVISFTIDVAPGVTSTAPLNGALGVARNTTITVNFTESVNATTASFTVECPSGAPQAYTLSGSPAASFTLTPTSLLPAGVICTVTVVASQVTDTDTGDPPDTMLANLVFSFSIPPDAMDDARGATGNVSIDTANTGFSVLANDLGPGITVTPFTGSTLRGGAVSVNAAGLFTYNPPVGYEGPDSFPYTISNAAGSDNATVNLTVSGMLWFIHNTAAACTTIAGGCGRLSDPFSTLPSFEAVNGGATMNGGDVIDPEAGDHVFIYTGSGAYSGPLTLENNQRVIGQGATSAIATLAGLTLAPDSSALPPTAGAKPTIVSSGVGIGLASTNQLHGLAIGTTSGAAISGTANVGTFAMSEIAINNTSGAGLTLTGGGTVTATGVNTIATTTGTALNVSNTNIGAAGLTFRSISASGGTNGIVLSNTGSSGGLTVTGSGGTCTDANTSGCTGGSIANMTGADNSSATPGGTSIVLNNTASVSLTRMWIHDNSNYAIRGTSVNGFTLANSVVNGVNGTNQSTPFNDGSLVFFGVTGSSSGMTGTSAITNSTIRGGFQRNIAIDNSVGTLNLTVSNNTIRDTSNAVGDDGLFIEADTTANVTATITNNTFASHGGDHFNLSLVNNAVANLMFTGNAMSGGHAIGLGQGVFVLGATFDGTLTYNISNNGTLAVPFTGNRQGGAIHVNKGSGSGTFTGRIEDNVIGDAGVTGSGSSEAFGIIVGARGAGGSHTTLIDGNTVRQYFDRGIVSEAGEGGAALNATVTNNTVSNFADAVNSLHGIHFDNGILAGDTNAVCIAVSGNSVATAGNEAGGGADIRLRKGSQAGLSVRLPGLIGSTNTDAATLIGANNPTATTVNVTGSGFTGGGACLTPP